MSDAPRVTTASEAQPHLFGIDWSGIDGTVVTALLATVAVVALIMRKSRRRHLGRTTPTGDGSRVGEAMLLNDISWGPGHHSHTGSDAGHHGGYFDGGGGDAGGGGHI